MQRIWNRGWRLGVMGLRQIIDLCKQHFNYKLHSGIAMEWKSHRQVTQNWPIFKNSCKLLYSFINKVIFFMIMLLGKVSWAALLSIGRTCQGRQPLSLKSVGFGNYLLILPSYGPGFCPPTWVYEPFGSVERTSSFMVLTTGG